MQTIEVKGLFEHNFLPCHVPDPRGWGLKPNQGVLFFPFLTRANGLCAFLRPAAVGRVETPASPVPVPTLDIVMKPPGISSCQPQYTMGCAVPPKS